jgi:lambda family phage portal protein
VRANLLDRAIGFVAPGTALKRIKARARLDIVTRAYAGAAQGRHTDGWRTSPTSADSEIASAGSRLRDRHRDLVRNNPNAAKAVSSWVTNLVGDGIAPRTPDPKVMALFKEWARRCDADGQLDFYGQQALAVREMVEGGEVLVRRRRRRVADGLPVPLQLQILEADFLDSTRNGPIGGNNVVVQGVEFSAIGARQNYWLFAEHPGNVAVSFLARRTASAPIPASEIIHLYEKQRTQVRGVPWGAPVIRKLRDLDDYDFAEGLRKKLEASYVGAVLCDDDDQTGVTQPGSKASLITDAAGNPVEQFEPGLFAFIRGGKDIKFNAPAAVSSYEDFDRVACRKIAAGYRLPYELLTGDLSNVNYSSIRAGLLEYRRLVTMIQWHYIVPVYCQPVWDWFCEAAYLAGKIDSPFQPVEWDTPRFEWVDPYKDGLADIQAIRAGIKTWHEAVAERGRNPEDVLAEIIAFNKKIDDAGLVLDTDPRKVSRAGLMQTTLPGTSVPEEAAAGDREADADDRLGIDNIIRLAAN